MHGSERGRVRVPGQGTAGLVATTGWQRAQEDGAGVKPRISGRWQPWQTAGLTGAVG